VHVACLLSDDDAVRKKLACFIQTPEAREQLAELKVPCHVRWMQCKEISEMIRGGGVVAELCAFERQTVTRKRVRRLFGNKLFQEFAARFLSWGHESNGRIIAASGARAKVAAEGERARRMKKTSQKHSASGVQWKAAAPAHTTAGKPVSASRSEMVELAMPNDANPLGNMMGGRVMHFIDIAGALAAHRHSNSVVVTASVDYIDFRYPIPVGEFLVLKSSVNRVFHTSMEVGVKAYAENILTGERKHTSSAYLTFVAIDKDRRTHPVPPLILETAADRRRFREAGERREMRLAMRHKRPPEGE
jgi:acyl-CoA hydrolase